MITFQNLTKRYGSLTAVDNLSFSVSPGRITGFLGPNGAGKTTTLRIATQLAKADGGWALFNGKPYLSLDKPARQVGLVLEPTVFHPGRTAFNHLMMLAPYAQVGSKRCREVLSLVGLADVANKRVGKFSLGMRGRLNLATSLLGDPGILLLDEPVNGLDPEGIRWVRGFLRALADEGRTILISSHILSEVQQSVDDVVIIAHGKLVFEGTLADLETSTSTVVVVETSDPVAFQRLAQAKGWTIRHWVGRPDEVAVEGPTPGEVSAAVVGAGITLNGLSSQSTDLESVFLALTEGQGGVR